MNIIQRIKAKKDRYKQLETKGLLDEEERELLKELGVLERKKET